MADDSNYEVPIRTIAHFMQILERQELREAFTRSAPQASITPPVSKPFGPDASAQIPGLENFAVPADLFTTVDQWRSSRDRTLSAAADIRLPLSPEMMEYARAFVTEHNLASASALTARLQAGNCPNPVECPGGV